MLEMLQFLNVKKFLFVKTEGLTCFFCLNVSIQWVTCNLKGIAPPELQIVIIYLLSCGSKHEKTIVHLLNTNADIFNEF